MDADEIKKLLQENLETSQEILKSVKKIKHHIFWQRIFKLAKWGIIIASLVFGYIQIQPYIESLSAMLQNLGETASQIQNLPNILQGLLP